MPLKGVSMSSGKFVIGGVFIIAAIAGSIPLFFHDYKRFSNNTSSSTINIPKGLDFSQSSSLDTIGTYNNITLKRSDLTSQERQTLFEAESQTFSAIESILAKRYFDNLIKDYMKKKNIANVSSAEQLYLREKSQISKELLKSFIAQNADNPKLKGKSQAEQEAIVLPYLQNQAASSYFRSLIAEAEANGIIEVTGVSKPSTPKIKIDIGDAPSKGPANAPITIVEFADFECPFCANAQPVVDEILKEYKDKIRFVFKNYPLVQIHPEATNAAIAGECANQQKKYWQMHDALFANHTRLGTQTYNKIAQNIGLNISEFNKCRNDRSIKEKITSEIEYGQSLGINATPAFYINGVQLMGAQPKAEFEKIIKKELATKN
ncbi:thioredoxin domain-containing protein [Fluviispira multicolorata]|uniref:Thioredoxin domain-containing protein n=2 Tax=Fluviispira multicolorata TaxID=2654512 RepID=A0A833JF69_9BACT|nr:thioredoxin domain-containing protein [Fluviispira multicolorata]